VLDHWALRVLVEVADRGSFSAAGDALSMTQPAVSRQIAGLERRLGVPLFRRVPRGVTLTGAGATAVELARDILVRTRTLEAHMSALSTLETGHLRLSAFASANTSLVPEAIGRFARTYPGVSVSLLRPDPGHQVSAVRAGRLDLALVTSWELYPDPRAAKDDPSAPPVDAEDVDGVALLPLAEEELLVALPADHRLAGRGRVPLRELADERWIEGAYPDCLGPLPPLADALGAPPRIGFFCDDWHGKQALVAAHAGVMLVPTLTQHTVRTDVVVRPTVPALPPREVFVAVAEPPLRPPAAAAMVAILMELCVGRTTVRPGGP
jgi:DNA-binding transcriptional LysR family regulator